MSGNTKLVGFQPRLDDGSGVILLERWGEKRDVIISGESLDKIREACMSLPQMPKQRVRDATNNFNVRYDESVGSVHVAMSPAIAQTMALLLKDCIEAGAPLKHDKLESWICSLEKAVKAHLDYHNREGEPGVEDTH